MKDIKFQNQEAQWTHKEDKAKQLIPRHIKIKLRKTKNKKILKSFREKQCITYKNNSLMTNFFSKTVRTKRKWHIFQMLKKKAPAKSRNLIFMESEINTFQIKKKRNWYQKTYLKRTVEDSYSNKGTTERSRNIRNEERVKEQITTWVNIVRYSASEF